MYECKIDVYGCVWRLYFDKDRDSLSVYKKAHLT